MPQKGGSKIPRGGALKSAKARYIGVTVNVRDWMRSSISEREEYLAASMFLDPDERASLFIRSQITQ